MGVSRSKEITLEATVEKLDAVNDFVGEMLAPFECSPKKRMQLDLVVEEIFVNIASYAYSPGQGCVTIRAETTDDPPCIRMTFMDEGMVYNPLAKENPDITIPLEEREIGGLGIFLVKKNVESIVYEYSEGKNILTIVKNMA